MMMLTLVLAAAMASPAPAQELHGQVAGTIVDATTGSPLAGAVLAIEPNEGGVLTTPRGPSTSLAARRRVTDAEGAYSFAGLPEGSYVLRVERVGYRPARVLVDLGAGSRPGLSLSLEVEPIPLERLVVSVDRPVTLNGPIRRRTSTAERARSEALRRDRYLESDARLVSGDDIAAAHTFPEEDLLRAVQRLPGISTRDDYSAELWTRGAPWSLTRVYLDDLPLLDPFFAGGTLTALAPGAAGAVFVLPGARPVSVGEGSAGVATISSRDAAEIPGLPASLELGLGTAQATLERRFLDGRGGLLFSARRSWFDRIWNTFVDDGHDPEGPFDYVASSSFWRGDVRFDSGARVVASVYEGGDEVGGNAAGLLAATAGHWGNRVAQAALSFPAGAYSLRLAIGRSAYDARVESVPEPSVDPVDRGVVALRPGDLSIRYGTARMELTPTAGSGGLEAGIEVVGQSLRATGVAAATPLDDGAAAAGGDNEAVAAWVSHRGSPRPRVDLEGGIRIQVGSEVRGLGASRLAPHLAVRLRPGGDTYLSLAARRSFQHLQQVGGAGTRFGGGHTFGHAWSIGGSSSPALTTDILSGGLETGSDRGIWLALNAWVRRVTGMTVPDPAAGVVETAPVRWVTARNRAAGAELQLRRWVGSVTGSATYSWVRSDLSALGTRFPSPADRRHTLDIVVGWHIQPTLRLLSSLRAHSGAPYTRVLPHPCVDRLGRTDACVTADPSAYRGPAGDRRGPGYASLDIGADWSRHRRTWGWGLSLRLNNVTSRSNHGGYRRTDCADGAGAWQCLHGPAGADVFYDLLPGPLPTVSARVWF